MKSIEELEKLVRPQNALPNVNEIGSLISKGTHLTESKYLKFLDSLLSMESYGL